MIVVINYRKCLTLANAWLIKAIYSFVEWFALILIDHDNYSWKQNCLPCEAIVLDSPGIEVYKNK